MQRGVGGTYAQDPGDRALRGGAASHQRDQPNSHPEPVIVEPPLRLSAVVALPQPWVTWIPEPLLNEPVKMPPVTLPFT